MSQHSVYWFRHKDHTDMFSQGYVGISKDPERRFSEHKKKSSDSNRYLKHAVAKYGVDNIVHTVLLVADELYCLNIEKKLRPTDSIGWNLVSGGGKPPVMRGPNPKLVGRPAWNRGKKMPLETKEKVRQAGLARWQNQEYRKHMSDAHKGKPSPRKGVKLSDDLIRRMSEARIGVPSKKKGTKLTGSALENTIKAARIEWTCPHCSKIGMGLGAANRWHFDNCKLKDSA